MQRLTLLAAAAAASLLVQAPAYATASSSSSITDLTITLVDLNTNDGVTPWISFAGQSHAYAYAYDTAAGLYPSDGYNFGAAAFDAVSATASTPVSTSTASATGSSPSMPITGATTVAGSLSSSGSTAGTSSATPDGHYGTYYGQSYWNGTSSYGFTVSANTLVYFTATGSSTAALTSPYTGPDPEYAYTYTTLSVSGPGSSGNGGQSSSDGTSVEVYNWGGPVNATQTQPLGASFLNLTGTDMTGYFSAGTYTQGYSYAAAVPEPETYAMMLAGLGAVGFIARRRQRR